MSFGNEEFFRSVIDSVNDHIAVLDSKGEIIFVNEAWKDFGDENDLDLDGYGVGLNYLEVVENADFDEYPEASVVADMLEEALNESSEGQFEYPCHGPDEKRWFICEITRIDLDESYVVVKHINITERKKAEEWAEFMRSTMNHDLKNKIQLMEGYTDLLEEEIGSQEDEIDRYLSKIDSSIVETKKLIKKIQEISKAKKEEIRPINLKSMLNSAIYEYEENLEEHGIDLDIQDSECTVFGGELLREAFKNLITNSIKHADCNRIKITTEDKGDICIITYSDDGKGIPDSKKEKVLQKGYSDSGGSGLGLYLVKKIIDRYNGEIEIGDSEQGGAELTLKLEKTSQE